MTAPNDIILFHYPISPSARRVIWYLALRGIKYAECIQPLLLPRPDLAALGIHYRRIPVLSIGGSVYCETRNILEKLESLFPEVPRLSPTKPDQLATQRLLSSWTVDSGVSTRAVQCLPADLPALTDPNFVEDRQDLTGRSWNPDERRALRPEGFVHMRQVFDFVENGFLADGRDWILNTEKPTVADIETIWPFHWMLKMRVAVPETLISPQTHPRLYAYMDRFDAAVNDGMGRMGKAVQLTGSEAVSFITQAEFPDKEETTVVDPNDPMMDTLKAGQTVCSWPTDSGVNHRDEGKLIKLDAQEQVLELPSVEGRRAVRLHHPRWNFRLRAVEEAKI